MKKLLFIIPLLLLFSCNDKGKEQNNIQKQPASVIWNGNIATLYYNSTYGNLGYILAHNPSKLGIKGITFYNSDKDELLKSIVSKNEDGSYSINFDPDKFKTINGKNYYLIGDEESPMIAFEFANEGSLENLKKQIINYIKIWNDIVPKIEFLSLSQTNLSNSAKKFFGNNFNILVKTGYGNGYVSDPSYKYDAGKIVSIDGYSFSSEFGEILLVATLKNGDKNESIVLALKDGQDLNIVCGNLSTYLTSMDERGAFFLNNPDFIRWGTEWQRQPIEVDSQGRYYKEIQFNNYNCDRTGLVAIPANFIGYSMRMILPREADDEMVIQMVDRDGNPTKVEGKDVMPFYSMNLFYDALKAYLDYYENPQNLTIGDDVSEYITNRLIGRTLDYDLSTPKTVETYFAGSERRKSYNGYGGDIQQFDSLERFIRNGEKANFANTLYMKLTADGKAPKEVKINKSVYTGDIVYDTDNDEPYLLMRYGNEYILVDGNGKFQGIYDYNKLANRERFVVFEGQHRGQKVNLQ